MKIKGKQIEYNVVTKTSAYTLTQDDDLVLVDATAGVVTITMPLLADSQGRPPFDVQKIDSSSNAVTVDGNGSNINGQATQTLALQDESLTMAPSASEWRII